MWIKMEVSDIFNVFSLWAIRLFMCEFATTNKRGEGFVILHQAGECYKTTKKVVSKDDSMGK